MRAYVYCALYVYLNDVSTRANEGFLDSRNRRSSNPTTRYDVLNLIQSCSSGNDDVIELSLLERIVRTRAINSQVRFNVEWSYSNNSLSI